MSSKYFFVALLIGAPLMSVSCSSDEAGTVCEAGRSVDCRGPGNCEGFQVCRADGSGFSECDCGGDTTVGAPDGGSSSGGAGGGAGGGSQTLAPNDGSFDDIGPNSGLIGSMCVNDDDCRAPLECLTSDSNDFFGGGPAGGLCTAPCSASDDPCQDLDPLGIAVCAPFDDQGTQDTSDDVGYCVVLCPLGPSLPEEDKCRLRPEVACVPQQGQVGACMPACGSDLDCATAANSNRFCNLDTGLCEDSAPTGDPIGTECDPDNDTCAGGCVSLAPDHFECSGVCTFGNGLSCGYDGEPGSVREAACTFSFQGADVFDQAVCGQLCDCNDDCLHPSSVCSPVGDANAATLGRDGLCTPVADGQTVENIPCTTAP